MESPDSRDTPWQVDFTKKAAKQATGLPRPLYETLALLKRELELEGPAQPEWPNYSKLAGKKASIITAT